MTFVQSAHESIGIAFSIVGLVLVVPTVFLFKQYNRFLDHCQMVFLFWISLAPTYQTFGSHLDKSWVKFIPNFLTFCNTGEIVCELGFALSWTICLVGAILLLLLIVTLQKCRKPDLRFQPIYSLFKGFFKWTYVPLAYYSVYYLIIDIKNGTRTNLIPSIIITAWVVVFPIIQLVYYKVIQQQKDSIWIKWFEFLGYARQLSIVVIFLLAQLVESTTTIAKYFVYGPLVLYAVLYMWKGIFINKIIERVLFGIEEAIMITIFSLYLFDITDLIQYEIDFVGLAIILLLHIIYITLRLVNWLVYGQLNEAKVNPQVEDEKANKGNSSFEVLDVSNDFKPKKKNKYEEPDELLGSRESLNSSIRKGNERRRR